MRANYSLKRIHVSNDLGMGQTLLPDTKTTHYLLNVLRLNEGAEVLLFNGYDGEWRAELTETSKRSTKLRCISLERPQEPQPNLELMFAPLKTGRLDYLVQKAVEMGVGKLTPTLTEYTQNQKFSHGKMRSYTIEAAAQCGVLALPELGQSEKLDLEFLTKRHDRSIIFCDETHEKNGALSVLSKWDQDKPTSLLIGPEGGFSDDERALLNAQPNVISIPLGPRILRADTAVVAALAIIQVVLGDWRDEL